MIKTLSKAQKMEREKFRIPRSVQDAIPIRKIFADGIFQVGNQYSKTWSFTDINYAIASKEDKTSMFLDYSELLPSRCYVTFCRGAQGWNCEVVQGVGKMEKKSTPNGLTVQAL